MGRRGRRSGLRSALASQRRFPVDLDQLDKAVDAEVGESHDALVFEPVDPDYAVFRFHFDGDVEEEVDVFAEFLGHRAGLYSIRVNMQWRKCDKGHSVALQNMAKKRVRLI
jgi:hypothetical protein